MLTLYDLRHDAEHIERVQRASRSTEEFGIEPTHGLYGSSEWWDAICSGALPVHTLRGTIRQVCMASMGDWPEIEVEDDEGERSRWTREVNAADQDAHYQPGRRIEIDYVSQRFRPKSYGGGTETRCVLAIRVA